MPPSVRILDRAFPDPRFRLLGELLGSNEFEALGRMAHVWRLCTERCSYELPERLVATLVDVEAMVLADLGVRAGDGKVRVKGTEGQVEWFGRLQQSGRNSALKRWGAHNSDGSPIAHPKPTNGSPIGDRMGGPREGEGEGEGESLSGSSSESGKGSAEGKCGPTPSEWPVVERVLERLSHEAGVKYASRRAGKPTNSAMFILRRLREGCTEDELRMVVKHRSLDWANKPEMREHLTAETLFGRQKFDTYLAKAKAALEQPEARAGPTANEPIAQVTQDILRGIR